MADIQALRTFVGKELNAGTWKLTGPLTHDEIRILATQWMPELRFHEDEHFHPISYKDLLRLRDDQTLAGPYYLKTVSDSQPPRPTTTHPPVFFKSEEEKVSLNPDAPGITSLSYMSNVVELRDPVSRFDTIDRDPWEVAKHHFGSQKAGNGVRMPALPVTAVVEYRDLREFLRLRVKAEIEADRGRLPKDSEKVLLDAVLGPPWFRLSDDFGRRLHHLDWLDRMVVLADEEDQGDRAAAGRADQILRELVADDVITEAEWKVMKNYALLEYFFVYAFNDYSKHNAYPTGDHEGDIEGFGVVFHRGEVAAIGQQPDRLEYLRNKLCAHYLVTAPHAEWQGLDDAIHLKDPQLASLSLIELKQKALKAWVLAGSHANVLHPGTYQNFDSIDEAVEASSALAAALAVPEYSVPAAILTLLSEHFANPEEETSDAGARSMPPWAQGQSGGPTSVGSRVLTTPLSADSNIYRSSWQPGNPLDIDITLAERTFPGAWGFKTAHSNTNIQRFVRVLADKYF